MGLIIGMTTWGGCIMNDEDRKVINPSHTDTIRPRFPKRAVITGGMPYGNKDLHLGHIGGVFVHADTFARFLRDRIGKDNVIFISGTDCYGSPIVESHRQLLEKGEFDGTLDDLVRYFHERQKAVLDAYHISLDFYGASAIGRAAEIHRQISAEIIRTLYQHGFLTKLTTSQFFDSEHGVFLNGRQVVGQCPIAGCTSERGYADECSLGHQYMPADLINPVSTLSGKKPEMREVTNWYFKLNAFHQRLAEWVETLKQSPDSRNFVIKSIQEFLEPPVVHVKRDHRDILEQLRDRLPRHTLQDDGTKPSVIMIFDTVEDREKACAILTDHKVRYRTGKTLVPFRLTGNVEWGVPAPVLEGLEGLTVWVWPESLWAPISFTKDCLEARHRDPDAWKEWWCTKEAQVYQFIGEDNVYFYGPVEMSLWMALQIGSPSVDPPEGEIQLPKLIVNNHILFLDKKASSSGAVKPPTAKELLDYYTPEQLRAHFLGLGLGMKSVGFQPKPFNPKAKATDNDPVLKEGNLLTNVFNRAVRSCFYTTQKYYDGIIPVGEISPEVLKESRETVLEYEELMAQFNFHLVMNLMDTYIRNINKDWAKNMKGAEESQNESLRRQVLIDTFHRVRTALVLMHPIAPTETEMVREYLRLGEAIWSWDRIFEPLYAFMENPETHKLKFLEPRVDFFKKHPSQFQ